MSLATPRLGFWAAVLAAFFGGCFSIVALISTFTTWIPELWVNPLSFAPSLPLAWSYLALMVCVVELVPDERRIWARLGLGFATVYVTINSIVYFTQLVVVSPALWAGAGDPVAVLQFTPRSFMLALNGLAYGLMSISALLASQGLAATTDAQFARWSMVAHGLLAPFVVGTIFWPELAYVGALWIVTFPAMAIGLAMAFRRSSAEVATFIAPGFKATLQMRAP